MIHLVLHYNLRNVLLWVAKAGILFKRQRSLRKSDGAILNLGQTKQKQIKLLFKFAFQRFWFVRFLNGIWRPREAGCF